jgi:hypothetical protein
MNRTDIINDLKNFFAIHELVGKDVYEKHGDNAWFVFRTETLHCLLIMRKGIGRPFEVNNWFWGGAYDERGYRSNIQEIVKSKTLKNKLYVSGHPLGCAIDYKVKGMHAERVRDWILENEDLFPCKIRLEHKKNGKPITWLHFDNKDYENNPKIYLFDV